MTTRTEIKVEERFLEFVAGVFEMDAADISLDTEYEGVPAWDSLMQLRLMGEICDEYDVDIPIDEVPDIRTLRDFYRYVERA